MATYHIQIHIESMGTPYNGGGLTPYSSTGHMWYEIYQRDDNGNIDPDTQKDAGYTSHGITNSDGENYAGDPAYSSREISLTQDQYDTLRKFGTDQDGFATQNGFGPNDYNVFTNSCIDFTWKALSLAGYNPYGTEGDLVPMWNRWRIEGFIFGNFSDNVDNHSTIPSDRANGEGLPWAYNPSTSLTSPLALDLNGDGVISLVSLNQSKTLFDVTGDGMAELTGWIGANDGILVNDVNNDGTIDNITEMFGNQVKINGFVALADKMDTNQDGVVNAQDTNFTSLQVWQDSNQDGISQNSELKTLTELGITEIRTASTPVTSSGDLTALFTCKAFSTSKRSFCEKVLHVKTNIEPKEANNGLYQKVA